MSLRRVVDEAFAEEAPSLKPLPAISSSAVLTVERRVTKDGRISVGGNFYPVPDTSRRRTLQHHATELRTFEEGQLIARHRALEGKAQRRVEPAHPKAPRDAGPPHDGDAMPRSASPSLHRGRPTLGFGSS